MLHPNTMIKYINDEMGYGVFATEFIPKGTITYVKDALEIEISPQAYQELDSTMQAITEKYSYIDERGIRIISWDFAKYVNHRCECNTMSTGWGFEIAIRDIAKGEEITDEYGLFNPEFDMPVNCGCETCRKVVTPQDLDKYGYVWDEKVKEAILNLQTVDQPLLSYMDNNSYREIIQFINGVGEYRSVSELSVHKHSLSAEASMS